MKFKLLSSFFTVLGLAFTFSASSQILNDSLVSLIPHWGKGENHSIKIKNTAINTDNGKSKIFVSLFDAQFKIIEASADGYVVEWEYTRSKLNVNDPEAENHILDKLKLNEVYSSKTKLANPLGGQLNDAVENVKLTKLDYTDSTCVIEINKVTDARNLKNSAISSIEKVSNVNSKKDKEIRNEGIESSESTVQQINFSKCIIRKSFYKRIYKFGSINRSKIMEIETVD